jgi:hypothetical protein
MNKRHAELLGTPEWAAFLHEEVLPVVTQGIDLGDDLLEIGPGPGAATDWLRPGQPRWLAVHSRPGPFGTRMMSRTDGGSCPGDIGPRRPCRRPAALRSPASFSRS